MEPNATPNLEGKAARLGGPREAATAALIVAAIGLAFSLLYARDGRPMLAHGGVVGEKESLAAFAASAADFRRVARTYEFSLVMAWIGIAFVVLRLRSGGERIFSTAAFLLWSLGVVLAIPVLQFHAQVTTGFAAMAVQPHTVLGSPDLWLQWVDASYRQLANWDVAIYSVWIFVGYLAIAGMGISFARARFTPMWFAIATAALGLVFANAFLIQMPTADAADTSDTPLWICLWPGCLGIVLRISRWRWDYRVPVPGDG